MKNSYLMICVLLLTACTSTSPIYSDYDGSRSFNSYKTFSWAHTPPLIVSGNLPVSDEAQSKATSAIRAELSAKGFVFVEDVTAASFLVAYSLGARDDLDIYQTASSVYDNKENWLWGKEHHSYFFDMVLSEDLREGYTKGVIAIDIFDTKTKAPVWHGKASKSLSESEISSNGGSLDVAVKAVLSNFPPRN